MKLQQYQQRERGPLISPVRIAPAAAVRKLSALGSQPYVLPVRNITVESTNLSQQPTDDKVQDRQIYQEI